MAILAFAASVIVLNAPPARSRAKEEAERFAARVSAAWEDSVIEGRTASVALAEGAYRIERFSGGEWRAEAGGRRFSERRMPPEVLIIAAVEDPAVKNARMSRDEEDDEARPTRIVLDPIGLTTPFRVEFRDRRERWVVRNRPDETIVVTRDE